LVVSCAIRNKIVQSSRLSYKNKRTDQMDLGYWDYSCSSAFYPVLYIAAVNRLRSVVVCPWCNAHKDRERVRLFYWIVHVSCISCVRRSSSLRETAGQRPGATGLHPFRRSSCTLSPDQETTGVA